MNNQIETFQQEVQENIKKQASKLHLGMKFLEDTAGTKYSYNFSWLGRPIIQCPQDIVAMQEIIWKVKPDLIIETGIAHGGSLVFSASMLALLEACGEIQEGKVLGIDIDIRAHNREAIEAHPMSKKITMFQGSSVDPEIVEKVHDFAKSANKVLILLDSNHTHEHVLAELRAYSGLVSVGSYCVVFDTVIEDMPEGSFPERDWGKGNNPKTAVREFLSECNDFYIDENIVNKLLITVAPEGYLLKIR